jgi:signal transduction histidine kinase
MTARNDAQEHGASKAVLRVAEASSDIDSTIRSLRRIASALRPPLLDQVGLVAALEAYAREFAERTGIKVSCDFPVTSLRLPADQSIGLYRIVQEALTNVARHSHASSVEISMVSDGGRLLLRVQDDGVGFDRSEASGKQSLGLLGMQERAKLAGAELAIESAPKKGTSISAVLMLPSTESVPSYSR